MVETKRCREREGEKWENNGFSELWKARAETVRWPSGVASTLPEP